MGLVETNNTGVHIGVGLHHGALVLHFMSWLSFGILHCLHYIVQCGLLTHSALDSTAMTGGVLLVAIVSGT